MFKGILILVTGSLGIHCFFNNGIRSVSHLIINSVNIFSNDSQTDQQNRIEEKNNNDNSGVTGYFYFIGKISYNGKKAERNRDQQTNIS